MALFIPQNENQSELQKRVAAELQEKARKKAEEADLPDGVTDSAYIKGTTGTSKFAWVWILIGAASIGVIIFLIASSL